MGKKRPQAPDALSGISREPVNSLREEILPLLPEWFFYPLICISLVVPNLVFAPGVTFFQSLHILKWTTALVPIGILSAVTGVMIATGPRKRKGFLVDPLGWMWLFLLLYITAQPAWLRLSSIPTFVREWMFFASLFITMLLCVNFFRRRDMFMLVLFGAGLNAALNVLFAELQVRVAKLPAFVLPVPGNYVGNTGQQNMLGIWVAMALLSGLVLHLMLMEERKESRPGAATGALIGLNMALLGVNAWGLFSTTSRQSLLAFAAGTFILFLMGARLRGKNFLKALAPVLLIALLGMGAAYQFNAVRTQAFVEKAESLAKGAVGEKSELSEADSGRLSIYATAWTMLKKHPFLGVGIGHFKWNYLDAQRDLFRRNPDSKLKWQYTMWAHSELFHWFCEMGLIGGFFLLGILGWCTWCIVKALISKKSVSLEGLWSVALLTLIWTVALWGERPFHRIEDALWLSLAFAFLGREFLPEKFSWTEINRPLIWKGFGLVIAGTAMTGLVFLGNGLRADHALARAMRSRDAQFQESMLEKAAHSLMVRDLSDRAYAEHYLALATARKDGRALAEGLARLEAYFSRQPQTRELNVLISWYGRLGNREKLETFTSYLKPGTYSIKPAAVPSSGK
jgi:O-antigen ligase